MNTLEKINKRIEEITAMKARDSDTAWQKYSEVSDEITKPKQAMAAAAEAFDGNAYAEAKAERDKLVTQRDMLEERIRQLKYHEYVTEEESDETFQTLSKYSSQLDDKLLADLSPLFAQMKKIVDKYYSDKRDTVITTLAWHQKVRPNYINPITTYPDGTHRSKEPVDPSMRIGRSFPTADDIRSFLNRETIKNIIRITSPIDEDPSEDSRRFKSHTLYIP